LLMPSERVSRARQDTAPGPSIRCSLSPFFVGPSPAASPAVAPGACLGVCCVPPPGVPIGVSVTHAPPASETVFPSSFHILAQMMSRNRFRGVVFFPNGAPADPGADFGVCGPPPWSSFSGRADFSASPPSLFVTL